MIIQNQSKREKTELILKNVSSLPAVPKIMAEALKVLDKETRSTSELNRVISKDQGLVSKILAIANSPMYGLQRKVTSLDYALLILGFTEIKSIISVLSMTEAFKNKTDNYLNQKVFWQHSFLTGSAAKKLAEEIGFPNSGEAFIAGFLHDMGITVMHRYFHSGFVQICEMAVKENLPIGYAENEILGMSHQEIGHYLLEKWNFPTGLCNAVLNHHNPTLSAENNRLLSAIIHFSDYITNRFGLVEFNCDSNYTPDMEAFKYLNLRDENPDLLAERYRNILQEQLNSVRY